MIYTPLAEKLRPSEWDHFVGQERLLFESGHIRRSLLKNRPVNLLLWGPPGCGKTSLATLYIRSFTCTHVDLHPSRFQTAEVKEILERAHKEPLFRPTILWIDEIHRLTRPQQDLLLKGVEEGTLVLIAATTENPSFVLSSALLSRLTVLTFSPLSKDDLHKVLDRALKKHPDITLEDEAKEFLASWAQGDARKLLSALEPIIESKQSYDLAALQSLLTHHAGSITSEKEGRYLLISALHKAVRGSDCQAALYWFQRLMHAGEDPLYLARRIIRMAIEDIGLADPDALRIALQAEECFRRLGHPEGDLALGEAVIYLALAPKSAASYLAFDKAKEAASQTGHISPPPHILNAPTRWMKTQGFGEGYLWDHDEKDAFSGQEYFPEEVKERHYYTPNERGFERELLKRLRYFQRLKEERQKC